MLFQNKLKTASRKIGGFFMRFIFLATNCTNEHELICVIRGIFFYLELFPAIRLYLFLAKEARKRIPLLSGLGTHFYKIIIYLKVILNTIVTLSEVEGRSNWHVGFDFAQPDKQYKTSHFWNLVPKLRD
jgi:hypothetical protein